MGHRIEVVGHCRKKEKGEGEKVGRGEDGPGCPCCGCGLEEKKEVGGGRGREGFVFFLFFNPLLIKSFQVFKNYKKTFKPHNQNKSPCIQHDAQTLGYFLN
jgi:hypothetical protein